jgi:hypothetical protein
MARFGVQSVNRYSHPFKVYVQPRHLDHYRFRGQLQRIARSRDRHGRCPYSSLGWTTFARNLSSVLRHVVVTGCVRRFRLAR